MARFGGDGEGEGDALAPRRAFVVREGISLLTYVVCCGMILLNFKNCDDGGY